MGPKMPRPQIVIDNPILDRPYTEPERHFRFDDDGITDEEGDRAEVVRWERSGPAAATAVTVPARLWRDGAGRWHLRW